MLSGIAGRINITSILGVGLKTSKINQPFWIWADKYSKMIFFIIPLVLLFIYYFVVWKKKKTINLFRKHVMITGGSSGIGLHFAHEVAALGADVTLIARDLAKLQKAKADIENTILLSQKEGKVQIYSVDLNRDESTVLNVIESAESSQGPIFMLVNCAGFSKAGKFEDLSPETVKEVMDVNFFGSFFITQAVVRKMKSHDSSGAIIFISSQAGLFGLYGFTAYSAAKGAVVRLAEALHMEVKPYNISVTVGFPPDTDTPGFEEENKTKPIETKLISESAGLFEPKEVAAKLLDDALNGVFMSTVGLEGFMLTTLCSGMSPVTDALQFLSQVMLSSLLKLLSAYYLWSFDSIVSKEYVKRMLSKKVK